MAGTCFSLRQIIWIPYLRQAMFQKIDSQTPNTVVFWNTFFKDVGVWDMKLQTMYCKVSAIQLCQACWPSRLDPRVSSLNATKTGNESCLHLHRTILFNSFHLKLDFHLICYITQVLKITIWWGKKICRSFQEDSWLNLIYRSSVTSLLLSNAQIIGSCLWTMAIFCPITSSEIQGHH